MVIRALFLATLLVLLPTLSGGCGKSTPKSGRALFMSTCARCHGEDGGGGIRQKDGSLSRNLANAAWQATVTDNDLRQFIRAGKRSMPAFGDILSMSQIDRLITFIRTLSSGH